jgi:hypothetical protein
MQRDLVELTLELHAELPARRLEQLRELLLASHRGLPRHQEHRIVGNQAQQGVQILLEHGMTPRHIQLTYLLLISAVARLKYLPLISAFAHRPLPLLAIAPRNPMQDAAPATEM